MPVALPVGAYFQVNFHLLLSAEFLLCALWPSFVGHVLDCYHL
jgi:hypothetical protein